MVLFSCSRPQGSRAQELLAGDRVDGATVNLLRERGLLGQAEEPVYLYSRSGLDKGLILLTSHRITVARGDTVESELLQNIFDMARSHAVTDEKESVVTIYPRDDTQFTLSFRGGTDMDELFFSSMRDLWRKALASPDSEATGE